MVVLYSEQVVGGRSIYTWTGLSTDTKPNGNLTGGCMFIEIDTAKAYIWNEQSSQWIEWG